MATRTFTGTIRRATGLPWASVNLRLDLVTLFAMADGTYPQDAFLVPTNTSGAFSVSLPVPDDTDAAATWRLLLPDGEELIFNASYSATPLLLENVVTAVYPPGTPNSFLTMIAASYETDEFREAVDAVVDDLGGDKTYRHIQSVAATTWTVTHGLGKYTTPTVVDTTKRQVEGNVRHIDTNTVELTFSASFAGEAFFN